jgi:hypothetical protein
MDRNELAIARTVIYASLFDYPLTLEQLHESLISSALNAGDLAALCGTSVSLRGIVECADGYFFPTGRRDLIDERRRREARSRAFLSAHRRALQLLCALPFTRMVALSGSIAHLNLEAGGDLDLFIVTRGRRVWTVSLATIVLTRLLGVRRVMCANFVMADTHLVLEQQDLFTANQILHLKPLFGGEVLEGFVAANPFVRRFYPNRRPPQQSEWSFATSGWLGRGKRALEWALTPAAPAIEWCCRHIYTRHLRRKSPAWRSPEQVRLRDDYLKLHTKSHRRAVLEQFDDRVEAAMGRSEHAAIA